MSETSDRQGVVMNPLLRKQLKLRAVEMGITVSELITNLVKAYLGKECKNK